MTNGVFEKEAVANAMRSLSTSVLSGPGSEKKKVYPTNYVDENSETDSYDPQFTDQSVLAAQLEDEEFFYEQLDQLAKSGDADALKIQSFENELTELFQEVPDLHSALLSYQEAEFLRMPPPI